MGSVPISMKKSKGGPISVEKSNNSTQKPSIQELTKRSLWDYQKVSEKRLDYKRKMKTLLPKNN